MKLSDMMKLGQLYLAGGNWQGAQLLDPQWIKEASRCQIETPNPEQDIWRCGYGYQFWMSPYEEAYRADGMYGQITTVLPKKGLVVAIQCPEEGNFDKVKAVLHEELLSAL